MPSRESYDTPGDGMIRVYHRTRLCLPLRREVTLKSIDSHSLATAHTLIATPFARSARDDSPWTYLILERDDFSSSEVEPSASGHFSTPLVPRMVEVMPSS